jgi:IclR family pca regulon transcriptional regulator
VLRLGAGYLGRDSIAARAQPTLDAVSEALGEHIAIGVLDGDEVITLAAANSPQSRYLAIAVQVGQRLPAEHTSLGRVLLAYRPSTDDAESRKIRADGYAVTDGLLETGLRALGVPIRDHAGDVVASMSVAVNAIRVPIEQLEEEFLPVMLDAADAIGSLI